MVTRAEHDAAVLAAHNRLALALMAKDAHDQVREKIDRELESADTELRSLARRIPK